MIALALVVLTCGLAAANGANDVSKGIATLVGAGVSSYRRAVVWGTLCSTLGALAAAYASQALVHTFTGKGLIAAEITSTSLLLAIACGAVGWLILATATGMPVSTTHSLSGALLGATIVALGAGGVLWSAVATKVALPLLLSPLLALLLVLVVIPALRPLLSGADRYCVCVEQKSSVAVTADGTELRSSLGPEPRIGTDSSCLESVARIDGVDAFHWLSSGATSFFRGMNDAPKILAIGVGAAAALAIPPFGLYALVAIAMAIGSLIAGFRVTRTLAEKVTPISASNGLAANLVTAALVGLASRFAVPVSTTHVSSGAVIGSGVILGSRSVRWKTVREMLLAWIVTLPVSGILAALAYLVLDRLG